MLSVLSIELKIIDVTKYPRNKLHAIPCFPTESFSVHIEDFLRSNLGITFGVGMIWGRGSFSMLYSV